MATELLPLLPGTLPVGACFASEQERLNVYMAVSSAQLAGGMAFYNYGPDKPSVDNQGYPWLRTVDMNWYEFVGQWRRPRPLLEQDPDYRIWWVGLEVNIPTVGGGSAGTVTPTSGPFWERDTDFDGRSPMCPGDIPSANPAKSLSVGEDYGEGAHLQTVDELAQHSHPADSDFEAFLGYVKAGQASNFEITGGTEVRKMDLTGETGGEATAPTGSNTAFNVIHPVRGAWFLKPTSRLYIIVP